MFDFLKKLFGSSTRPDTPDGFVPTRSVPTSAPPIQPESRIVVHVSDTEVRCERPDGRVESVTWNDLQAVIIETTDAGPIGADVFWILAGTSTSSGCVIPQGATGDSALLERLQKLPGFDNEAFIRSMTSTDNEKFLCWQRPK